MRAAPQWLRRQSSVSRRGILIAVALSILGVVVDNASAASKSTSGGATLALPKTSAEVAPFVAPMDDRQVRSLLVRVLEELTHESKPIPEREMLTRWSPQPVVWLPVWARSSGHQAKSSHLLSCSGDG